MVQDYSIIYNNVTSFVFLRDSNFYNNVEYYLKYSFTKIFYLDQVYVFWKILIIKNLKYDFYSYNLDLNYKDPFVDEG